MNAENHCPQCGAALAADVQGHCPACLLARGLESNTLPAEGEEAHAAASPPSPADLAPYFPDLEILEFVGRGGMGMVYKARQKHLDRLVALKILAPKVGKEPAFAERFAREARAMAMLSHPQIVAVHDFGQTDGLYYFLMEYVDGLNLRQLLNAGKLSPPEALAIVPQICDALQFAHQAGVVHRDIKPENILLDKHGRVKVADFGLAKLMGAQAKDLTLTDVGQVMGTPHYMAPEQLERPQAVDHRADIYSLGVVFYQMLTGELPLGRFAAPSRKVRIDVRLDEVVLRALEKEPQLRYQQVSQIKTEVESIAASSHSAGGPDATPQDRARPAKRQLVASAAWLKRRGKKLLFLDLPVALLVVFVLQTFVIQSYRAATDAVSPEIPHGSWMLVYKLVRSFEPGDIVAYWHADKTCVGRVTAAGPHEGVLHIQPRRDAPDSVAAADIIGKVIFNTRASTGKEVVSGAKPIPKEAAAVFDQILALEEVLTTVAPDAQRRGGLNLPSPGTREIFRQIKEHEEHLQSLVKGTPAEFLLADQMRRAEELEAAGRKGDQPTIDRLNKELQAQSAALERIIVGPESPPAIAARTLEFHVVPNPPGSVREPWYPKFVGSTKEDFVAAARKELAAKGPAEARPDGGRFQWIEAADPAIINRYLSGEYQQKKYLLVCAREPYVLLPKPDGKDAWGLEAVSAERNQYGPQINLRFNRRGGKLFSALTRANLENVLAVVINGRVLAVPTVRSELREQVAITGQFSDAEIDSLVATLKGAHVPAIQSGTKSGSNSDSAPAEGPLQVSPLPDGWKLKYNGTKGIDFYSITPSAEGSGVLMFSKWPPASKPEDLPTLVRQIADGFVKNAKQPVTFALKSDKYDVQSFVGEHCQGSYVVFGLSGAGLQAMFMLSVDGQTWNGQFTGTPTDWNAAMGLLRTIKSKESAHPR